jgi:signal peptidase
VAHPQISQSREVPIVAPPGPAVAATEGWAEAWAEALAPPPSPSRSRGRGLAAAVCRAAATLVAVLAVGLLAAVAVGPRLGLFRIETVLSGSMRPTFGPGDLILVTPEPVTAVRPGQVISYQIPIGDHHVESHRVVSVKPDGERPIIETRGDNNSAPDPWRARLTSSTAWRVRAVIPAVGNAIVFLRTPTVHLITVLLVPALLAAWWLLRIWRPRHPEPGPS